MTSNASLPYPCSFMSIRGETAFLQKNKKQFSKRSEPNIRKLPGPPSDPRLGEKSVFSKRPQEVIENNSELCSLSPENPIIECARPLSLQWPFSPNVRN
jgi:hypothetical protein